MHKIVNIELGANIFAANNRIAEENRELLKKHNIVSVDIMGSIGSGKTLLIERMMEKLKKKGIRCGAIAGDVAGDDDYRRFCTYTTECANINTGKECHLDAHALSHALEKINLENVDVLFVENVGNLVCPADFPLGTDKRIVVISCTEGEDMIRKHPNIFAICDLVVLNKTDLAEASEVNPVIIEKDLKVIDFNKRLIKTSAKKEEGIEELIEALGL